jgi:glycosyltransferase involved in cell wall biosynthesis
MEAISAVLITYNEERNIREALESVKWADEIVVVDSGSSDGTLEICARFTSRIFHRDWTGFVDQKNYALDQATHSWVLSLDADERLSPELLTEIQQLRQSAFSVDGYRIPRVAFFMGRWIRHGDWFPDYQLRLFDKRRARWQGRQVHESVKIAGSPGRLKGEILHYTYRELSDYLKRLEKYSRLAAIDYQARGKISSGWKMFSNPIATFIKAYLVKRGFLDGVPGFMVAAMGAVSVFFKYASLYELQRNKR